MVYGYDKDTLFLIKNFLNELEKERLEDGYLRREVIEFFMDSIVPRSETGQRYINYIVNEYGDKPAYFHQGSEKIVININKLFEWLSLNLAELVKLFEEPKLDESKLARYLIAFVLIHEVKHSYQYLMGKGVISGPCQTLRIAYQILFDLLAASKEKNSLYKRFRRELSRSLYIKKRELYLLERNANVEGYDLICSFAEFDSDEEMFNIFMNLKAGEECIGYLNNRDGCLINTFKKLLIDKKVWPIGEDLSFMSFEERIRYGLEIDEETRKHVLAKV